MVRRIIWLPGVLTLLLVSVAVAATTENSTTAKKQEDYYELYKILVDTMDQVERNYVKEVDRRELIEAAIEGMLKELDPYSSYIPPEEISSFQSSVESEFGGIGIQISLEKGQLTVVSPLVGTPGYRAGLLSGDRIVKIDDHDTEDITLEEAVRRLKGEAGTKVTLTVLHPHSTKETRVEIVREQIHVETVLGDRRTKDDTWEYTLQDNDKIGYLRVTAFSRDTAREIREVLHELRKQNLRGLVLDLRFNPGGLLSSAIEVCDLFVAKGRIVSTQGRNTPERIWDAEKRGTFEGFPVVILVNRFSASASEIVSACLQDHKRAVVIGERTWGKGSVQNLIELEGGHSALKLTTAAYRRPSGNNIHRFKESTDKDQWGVMPDEGFRIELSDKEIRQLMQHRRKRDIVKPKTVEATEATNTGDDTKAKKDQPEDAKLQDKPLKTPKAKKADARESQESDPPTTKAFVDRQLEKALEYLSKELAQAKATQ